MKHKRNLIAGLLCSFLLVGCSEPHDIVNENCHFLNEEVNLHEDYYVTAKNVFELDNIEILHSKDALEKQVKYGKPNHFIGIDLSIKQIASNKPDDHKLDENDFKLKDHNGIEFNGAHLIGQSGGVALSKLDFETKEAVTDYTWIDKTIDSGKTFDFTVYFEVSKEIKAKETMMILEVDFYTFKKGIDIVLIDNETAVN